LVTCDGVVLRSDITFTNAKKGPHGGLRAGNIMRCDPKTGAVSVYRSPAGMSNGFVVGSEGNLWVAVRNQKRPGIYAYTPAGEEKAYIPTTVPTNVHFGRGEDADPLRITADNSLYRIRVGEKGHHLQK
jgi:sugar lactone lactonase YvrE